MGAVYEAERVDAPERVAVKMLRNIRDEAQSDKRFLREIRAASAIHDDHVAKVLDAGVDDATRQHYLVMELLQGEDLQALITRLGPLSPDVALRIASQALRGLICAHEAHVVHRDLKPSNVFLARKPDGSITVKLVDFGIAKILTDSADRTALTRTGGLLGSPAYMSPEQVEDTRNVDPRTDLWSLGATVYCAIAGHPPHTIESLPKLLSAIGSRPVKRLDQVVPGVSPNVAKFVAGALTIDRNKRYSSAGTIGEALPSLPPTGDSIHVDMLVPLPNDDRGLLVRTMPQNSGPRPFLRAKLETVSSIKQPESGWPLQAESGTKQPESGWPLQVESGSLPRRLPLRRIALAMGLAVSVVATIVLIAGSSRRPMIAPVPEGKRGIVLAGAFLGTDEGRHFCREPTGFESGQPVGSRASCNDEHVRKST